MLETHATGAEHRRTRGLPDARQFYRAQFNQADADNNEYLEMEEAAQYGVFDAETFKLMDRDGDGKLFEKEMEEFVAQESDTSEGRTMLSVVDQGRSLFNVVDANRDRRLSEREIAGILDKVHSRDRDGDGRIAAAEILTSTSSASAGAGRHSCPASASAHRPRRRGWDYPGAPRGALVVRQDGPQPRRRRLASRIPGRRVPTSTVSTPIEMASSTARRRPGPGSPEFYVRSLPTP